MCGNGLSKHWLSVSSSSSASCTARVLQTRHHLAWLHRTLKHTCEACNSVLRRIYIYGCVAFVLCLLVPTGTRVLV
jgi:hypothetical protein